MCLSTPSEASPKTPLRLLPWTTDEGKRCYLSADGTGSRMSRLADEVEEDLLVSAEWLLEDLGPLAGTLPGIAPDQLPRTVLGLANALRVTLRIAESRGRRLEFARGE